MATTAVYITAVVFCAILSSTYAAQGIICLVPRSLEKNAVNKLYLSLYEIDSDGTVAISLQNMDGDKTIAETIVNTESGESEKVFEFYVPETQEYRARIWVNGTFDNYNFTEQEELYLHSVNPIVVFIQTDKPLYKPGQDVKFRILVTDRYLRPLSGNPQIVEVYVEDPSGSRIAQWKNVSITEGMRQFSFPLSDEPPLGSWKISLVQQDSRIEAQYFSVEEYVLPKYEVTVKPPSFVMADVETIPVKICALYTYGKAVQGNVTINSSLESYTWSSEKFPVVEYEAKIDGCLTYNINVSLIDNEFRYSYRRIQVSVEVTEDGTDVKRNGSVNIQRTQNALTLEFLDDEYKQYFKPGIPYRKKIKATKPDDTPASGEEMEICATISRQRVMQQWWAQRKVKYCKNYTTDESGIVTFQVPPQKTDAISLYLEAKSVKYGTSTQPGRPRIYQPQTSSSVQPYFSPSKSYIQIQNTDDTLPCGTSQKVSILYTAEEGASYTFYYQVVSKGRIIEKGSKEVTYSDSNIATSMCKDSLSVNDVRILLVPSTTESGVNTDEDIDCSAGPIGVAEITINVAAALSPSIRLVVHYIRNDDETVADSSKFQVEKCFQNKVEFSFGDEEKQPGTKTSISLKASPNSLCGTKVLDKSITLLDSTDPLTKEKVFQELQKYDQQQYYQRNHCNDKFRKGGRNKMSSSMILPPRPWSSSQYADALTAFEDAGMAVLSDFKLLNRPCAKSQSGYDTGYGGFALASVGVRGGAPISAAVPEAAFSTVDRNEAADYNGARKSASSASKSAVDVRSFFPETWLFDLESVGESGEMIGKAVLPHTITEWIGSAVCINEADGLGLSNTARIVGFQAFFTDVTLPYSVIRGERVPLIVSIFNYLDKCLPITRTIHVAVVSDNGTVASEASKSEDVCVCGGKTDTYRYMFTPEYIGSLNLTVSAESAEVSTVCGDQETAGVVARDALAKSLKVEAEGFKQERVSSFLFCPEDYEGSTYTNKLDLTVPQDAVEGSQRAFISLSGDIMGPAIENLDRLVQLPTGCGEQNMVLFTPNIVALDYLTSIGKLTEQMRNRAITNLQAGYQRELKYRHPDGSYSAFGISDREGSMWLTAFVLRSFMEASKYISIDQVDIARSLNWIVQKQQADGCFPKVGKMFSEGMKGGIGSQGSGSTAPLTAYVLAALIVSGFENETAVNSAMTCIGKDTELNPYTAALYAYVSTLAGRNNDADRFLGYLDAKEIREGDEIFWRNVNGTKSLNLETAAYAVMAILRRKGDAGLSKALSVVRHMTKMRNANGGFVSTQDTVVGLQAIAFFASIISQDPVDLVIEVKGGALEKTVTIKEEDKLLVKKSRVPVVPSTVDVVATGAGCGLLQASVRYNTLQIPKQQFFSLSVNAARKDDCKKAEIIVCVQYLPEQKRSNMAILEIKMVSGFAAVKESLDKLLSSVRQYIKRYDIDENKAIIYFDELSNENVCFSFDAEQVIEVEDTKPATAKLYDYYAKEKEESTDYRIDGSC